MLVDSQIGSWFRQQELIDELAERAERDVGSGSSTTRGDTGLVEA